MIRTRAASAVVHNAFSRSAGMAGAPGSLPDTTSPASAWLRTPKGSTAKSAVHQTTN